MRVSTFQAATLDDAMAKVRAALGSAAVVLSWRHVRGGVELTASAPDGSVAAPPALRARPGPDAGGASTRRTAPSSAPPSPSAADDPFGAASRRPREHEATGPEWDAVFARRTSGVGPAAGARRTAAAAPSPAPSPGAQAASAPAAPRASRPGPVAATASAPRPPVPGPSALARFLHLAGLDRAAALRWARAGDAEPGLPLRRALLVSLEAGVRTAPIDAAPRRPIALVGPPGAGKTATAAKLAARALAAGTEVLLIGADTLRTGGLAQLRDLALRLEAGFERVETAAEVEALSRHARARGAACFIDCAAAGAHDPAELRQTARFVEAASAEPVLCLPADARGDDLGDLVDAFAPIGVSRAIVTRLDLTRRRAGFLTAIEGRDLGLAQLSATPFISGGLVLAGHARLAGLIADPIDDDGRAFRIEGSPADPASARPGAAA